MAVAGYEIAAYGAVDAADALGVAAAWLGGAWLGAGVAVGPQAATAIPPAAAAAWLGGAWLGAGVAVVPQAAMAIAVLAASAASLVDHLGLWNMLPTPPHGPPAGGARHAPTHA